MAKLGKATVEITGNLKPLRNALKSARVAVVRSARRIGRAGFRAMTNAVRRAGRAVKSFVKIIGFSFVAAIGFAIKAAAGFEKQMATLFTMMGGGAKEKELLKSYGKDLRNMSGEFGESTATLSKGLYDIRSAQIPASKAMEFLRSSTTAAIAGLTDTATATKLMITVMSSYGMEAGKSGEVADKLFTTVRQGLTTFPELAGSLGRVAATASVAGMSFDELLAVTATATRGIGNTNEAVTAINGVLRAFLSPQQDAIDAAAEFGVVLSSTTLKEDGFIKSVKKLTEATPEQLSAIVGNIRGFKGLAVALKDQTGLNADYAAITEDSAGRAQLAFDIMADTTSFKFRQLKQTVINTFRTFGDPLLRPVKNFIDILQAEFVSLTESFSKNFGGIQKAGQAVTNVFEKILNRIYEYVDIAKDPKKGLTVAFTTMFEDLKTVFTKGWETFKEHVMPVITEVGKAFGDAFMVAFGNKIKEGFYKYTGIGAIKKYLGEPIGNVAGSFTNAVTTGWTGVNPYDDRKKAGQAAYESIRMNPTPVGTIEGGMGGGN